MATAASPDLTGTQVCSPAPSALPPTHRQQSAKGKEVAAEPQSAQPAEGHSEREKSSPAGEEPPQEDDVGNGNGNASTSDHTEIPHPHPSSSTPPDSAGQAPPPSPPPAAPEPSGLVQPSQPGTSAAPPPSSGAASTTPFPAIPASVRIPILVGPVPAAHASSGSPPKPIVLHENTLILNPEIFSHLTPQHLQDLEALGAQKALEILQAYIVRYYKEKLRAEGGRGRGRGRPRRGRGGPPAGRGAGAGAGTSSGAGRAETSVSGPFTTAPLPPRGPKPMGAQYPLPAGAEEGRVGSIAAVAEPPVDAPSPILVVDDEAPALAEMRFLLEHDDRIGRIITAGSGMDALRALES